MTPDDDARRHLAAMDRVQDQAPARTRDTSIPLGRWIRALAIIATVVGLVVLAAVWISDDAVPEESDLIVRMSLASDMFLPAAPVADGDEASAWVMDQYGWPIVIPDLPRLQLVGAGETALREGGPDAASEAATWVAPTFRYVGAGAENVVLYAYDYAQLDQTSEWIRLPQGVYGRLAEDTPFDTRRIEATSDYAVTWRRRAVLYTAVTESEAVVERLTDALSVEAGP